MRIATSKRNIICIARIGSALPTDIKMCLNPCLLKTLQSASDRGLMMRVAKVAHIAVLIMQRTANVMVLNAHESTGLLNFRFTQTNKSVRYETVGQKGPVDFPKMKLPSRAKGTLQHGAAIFRSWCLQSVVLQLIEDGQGTGRISSWQSPLPRMQLLQASLCSIQQQPRRQREAMWLA